MKTLQLFIILSICTIDKNISQKCETGISERVDTIITFDTETKVEEIKILKFHNVYMNVDPCDSPAKLFIANESSATVSQIRELSSLEFRCNGQYQREWENEWKIVSFQMVLFKAKRSTKTLTNPGSQFTTENLNFLAELKPGDKIAFEKIILQHPQKGEATAGFSLRVQ